MSEMLEEAAFRGWAASAMNAERRSDLRALWQKLRPEVQQDYRKQARGILAYAAERARGCMKEADGVDRAPGIYNDACRDIAAKLAEGQ